jgi:hypothetical protein
MDSDEGVDGSGREAERGGRKGVDCVDSGVVELMKTVVLVMEVQW